MKILLAIDGSPCSKAAVAEVCRRPWPEGSEVRIVTVDTPIPQDFLRGSNPGVFDEIVRRALDEANNLVWDAARQLGREAPALRTSCLCLRGSPKDMILDEAEQWPADLIVVGSQGKGAFKRLLLGSVSLAVAAGARCSVEIVRAPAPT